MKLPKTIIAKYGISKKAWAVFRGRSKKTKKVSYMAKRGKSVKRSVASSMLGQLNKPAMGAIGVIAYEALISPRIPVQGVAKDLLELGAGLYLQKKGGILGATGKTLVTLNSYQLLSGLATKYLPMINGGGDSSSSTNVYG